MEIFMVILKVFYILFLVWLVYSKRLYRFTLRGKIGGSINMFIFFVLGFLVVFLLFN